MRLNYKNGTKKVKRKIIQEIYNLMNLSYKCNVFRLINNKSAEVMNETKIKISIGIFFIESYDKFNLGMEKFNITLSQQ